MALVYVARYITKIIINPVNVKTIFIIKSIDHTYQWLFFFFCFILFHTKKETVCYKSLSNIFMLVSEFHFFNMEKKHASIFANIVLKFFGKHGSSRSEKEPALKFLKLFLEWFCLIYLYFWDDWLLYRHFCWCLPAFSGSVCQTQLL